MDRRKKDKDKMDWRKKGKGKSIKWIEEKKEKRKRIK